MASRRGRLNWSNLEVHISDHAIDKQHRFSATKSFSSVSTSPDNPIAEESEIQPTAAPVKRGWVPRKEVGEIQLDHYIGNFMLTNAEQSAIDTKYTRSSNQKQILKPSNQKETPKSSVTKAISQVSPVSKPPVRISNRLPSMRDTPISLRTTNLAVGQHLLNVFVCHVESFCCVYIMFGDDYNRATKLFQEMNTCDELIRPSNMVFEPKENDLVALQHEQKWFRGRCLSTIESTVNVLCVDSGAIINCSRRDLRRLPDRFRTCPPCCIKCALSGLPSAVLMSAIPDDISAECFELLYKDRYEAVVTKLEMDNRPTIVLYYGDENINDRLSKTLQLI